MEYRYLGKSGLQVSALSFGSWLTFGKKVDESTAEACMKTAYDNGINFFDNAEIYARGQSEIVMGNIIKKMEWPRDTFVVSSKVYFGTGKKGPNQTGLGRKHVFEACHAALKRLQVDYLDLFYCHRPDKNVPVEETVRIMTELINQGKVLYWGTSMWSAQEIMEAYSVARQFNLIPPTMEQPRYNMFSRENIEVNLKKLYDVIGLGTTIFSPLASGLLTGKYNEGIPEGSRLAMEGLEWLKERQLGDKSKLDIVKQLSDYANKIGTTISRLALAWCMTNPDVSSVITGASRPEQLEDNLYSIETLELLDNEVMENIENILSNKPVQ